MIVQRLLLSYENFKPFSEAEAWGLFRLSAIAEAIGWSILISGIAIGRFLTPHNTVALQFAGHIHGMLFLIYIAAVVVLYPSQGWSRRRTLVAGVASVPPFGSLLFELWAAYKRRQLHVRRYASITTYNTILHSELATAYSISK